MINLSEEEITNFASLARYSIMYKDYEDLDIEKLCIALISAVDLYNKEKLKNETLKGTNDDLNSLYLEEKEKNKDLEEDETIKDLIHKIHIIKNAKVVNADDYISKDELKNILRRVQDYQLNYKDTVLFNIIMQEIFGETE